MKHLDLSDEEAAALTRELAGITGNDRYPFSERAVGPLRRSSRSSARIPSRASLPPSKFYVRRRELRRPQGGGAVRDPSLQESYRFQYGFSSKKTNSRYQSC